MSTLHEMGYGVGLSLSLSHDPPSNQGRGGMLRPRPWQCLFLHLVSSFDCSNKIIFLSSLKALQR